MTESVEWINNEAFSSNEDNIWLVRSIFKIQKVYESYVTADYITLGKFPEGWVLKYQQVSIFPEDSSFRHTLYIKA